MQKKDYIIIWITTGGNSKNILKVFEYAREAGITTMALKGRQVVNRVYNL